MYKKSIYISKSNCSVKILFVDIKSEFLQMLSHLYKSKLDRCYCYNSLSLSENVNFQYRENVIT